MEQGREMGQASHRGYEQRDMSVRAVGLFLLGLIVSVGVVLLLMGWLFAYFAARAANTDVPPSPLAETRQAFPEPRLQVNGREELKALRAAEDAALDSYGWVDRKAGVVRIPVDRAMDLLTTRGLPTRGAPGGTR